MASPTRKSKTAVRTADGIPVGFLEVYGVSITKPPAALASAIEAYVASLVASATSDKVLADPNLTGYQALHSTLGKTGRQWLPSPASVFKILFKRGGWRTLGPIIDCYSLVSLQTRVSIGAHDLAQMHGGEIVHLIGDDAPIAVSAGEYCYQDAGGALLGRMEIRQAAHSKVTDTTRDVFFIVQGHAALGLDAISATVDVLLDALKQYCGDWSHANLTLVD